MVADAELWGPYVWGPYKNDRYASKTVRDRVRVSVYSLPDDGVRSPIQNDSDYVYIQGNGTTPPGSIEGSHMVYEYSYRLVLCCNVFDFQLSKSRSHIYPSICCLVKESNVYVESSVLHKSCEIKGAQKL